jgi:hypothetical protein
VSRQDVASLPTILGAWKITNCITAIQEWSEIDMAAEAQRPGNSPWQFTLLDYVEISAAMAPCAWCLTWDEWEPTDWYWLLGLQLSSGLILFLVTRFLRVRGIAYSLSLPFLFSQLFVLWLPGNVALWFPGQAWAWHDRLSQAATLRGQFQLASLAVITVLAILGGLTGHCAFKLLRRVCLTCSRKASIAPSDFERSRWTPAVIVLESIPIAALGIWLLYGFSMPRIAFHAEIGGSLVKDGSTNSRAREMRQWTVSKDSRRILMLDFEDQLHDLNFESGTRRVTNPIVPPRNGRLFRDKTVHLVRECTPGQLAIFWSPSFDHSVVYCHIVDLKTGQIADRLGDFEPLLVKGVSPSGNLVVTQREDADILGVDSLLVWNMDTRTIHCELEPKSLAGDAKDYWVLLNDAGTFFAADIRRDENQPGREVTIRDADAQPILTLQHVECLGEFANPPLVISRDGKLIWGRFAGLHDPQTNFHPVVERVVSSEGKSTIMAESEFGGMNLNETLSLDPNHPRLMKLKQSSEFDSVAWNSVAWNGSSAFSGEPTSMLPLVGVQCFKQYARRRLRLCDANTGAEIAKTITIEHLTDHWFADGYSTSDDCPYVFSPGAFQFSPNGQFAIFVPGGGYGGFAFDIWRLPKPLDQ